MCAHREERVLPCWAAITKDPPLVSSGSVLSSRCLLLGGSMVFLSPLHLAREAYVTRITKLKILVQFVQICSRLPSAFRLSYPPFVHRVLSVFSAIEIFDVFTLPMKLGCWRRLSSTDR